MLYYLFSLINILNCLPPLLASYLVQCFLKHLCTRLTILTSSFLSLPNHKIKIAETGQLAVGIRTLDCKYTFIISETADCIGYGDGGISETADCIGYGDGGRWRKGEEGGGRGRKVEEGGGRGRKGEEGGGRGRKGEEGGGRGRKGEEGGGRGRKEGKEGK